jgi:hypothetical protein
VSEWIVGVVVFSFVLSLQDLNEMLQRATNFGPLFVITLNN